MEEKHDMEVNTMVYTMMKRLFQMVINELSLMSNAISFPFCMLLEKKIHFPICLSWGVLFFLFSWFDGCPCVCGSRCKGPTANAFVRLYSPHPWWLIWMVEKVEVRMVCGSWKLLEELGMAVLISILGQWLLYDSIALK